MLFRQVLNQAVSQAPFLPPPSLRGGFQALLQDPRSLSYCHLFMGFSLPPARQGGAVSHSSFSAAPSPGFQAVTLPGMPRGHCGDTVVALGVSASPAFSIICDATDCEGRVWRSLSASYRPLSTAARRISREKLRESLHLPLLLSLPSLGCKNAFVPCPEPGEELKFLKARC